MEIQWTKIGNIATVTASLIAIFGLCWQIKESNELSNAESLGRWQKAVVFSIVSDSGLVGTDFNEIKTKYLQKVRQNFNSELDSTEAIQDSTLILLLIRLRAINLIYKSVDERYKERVIRDQVAIEESNEYIIRRKLSLLFLKTMSSNSCKLSISEMEKTLLSEIKAELKDVNLTISTAIGSRYVTLNKKKKLCLLQDYDPQHEAMESFENAFKDVTDDLRTSGLEMMIEKIDEIVEEIRGTVNK